MPENTTPDQPQQPQQPGQPQDETAPIGAASGSRWEQAAQVTPPTADQTTQYVAPSGPAPTATPTASAAPAKPGRSILLAGVAAGTLLVVGAGAFVAGRASAGPDELGFRTGQQWQQGVPGQGLPGQGTVPGQGPIPGQGTIPGQGLPGEGVLPGAPEGDDDAYEDDDHDFHFGFGDDDDHDEDED